MMILVTGARGVVGTPLCQQLDAQGRYFMSVSRKPQNNSNSIAWDLEGPVNEDILEQISVISTLIHCAPIWLLPDLLPVLRHTPLQRLVVFSSTSVISKTKSSSVSEQALVARLSDAEQAIGDYCADQGWDLTVLRPSLIYGHQRDQNIMHIARFIRRFGFMLLAGKADGKRQPVHADDLVTAALSVLENDTTVGQTYNLAGGEVLTYREMVERIFTGLGRRSKIVSLPVGLYRTALKSASLASEFEYTPEMADRMSQDMSYDISAAKTDFGFSPQAFLDHPVRDLGAD